MDVLFSRLFKGWFGLVFACLFAHVLDALWWCYKFNDFKFYLGCLCLVLCILLVTCVSSIAVVFPSCFDVGGYFGLLFFGWFGGSVCVCGCLR